MVENSKRRKRFTDILVGIVVIVPYPCVLLAVICAILVTVSHDLGFTLAFTYAAIALFAVILIAVGACLVGCVLLGSHVRYRKDLTRSERDSLEHRIWMFGPFIGPKYWYTEIWHRNTK